MFVHSIHYIIFGAYYVSELSPLYMCKVQILDPQNSICNYNYSFMWIHCILVSCDKSSRFPFNSSPTNRTPVVDLGSARFTEAHMAARQTDHLRDRNINSELLESLNIHTQHSPPLGSPHTQRTPVRLSGHYRHSTGCREPTPCAPVDCAPARLATAAPRCVCADADATCARCIHPEQYQSFQTGQCATYAKQTKWSDSEINQFSLLHKHIHRCRLGVL